VADVTQDGTPIESGQAVEIGVRSGKWTYTMIQPVAQATAIFIEINDWGQAGAKA
jgi:hypothetical protein